MTARFVRPLGAALMAVLVSSPGAAPAQGPAPRVVEITAERFEFWPSEIIVAEGEQVELRLRSDDTMHGFRIVGAGTNVLIPKRGRGYAVVRFTGDRQGRYTFECNRMCGAGHNFMRGVLVVRPQ
ncbi:MAG: cupredoxin domain-containing protein [Vicinamibacterales bacterium]